MHVLEIENVSKRFKAGNYGVKDFTLSVPNGVLGLLGPNGAGKTTLMQMIATITRPTAGRILFLGTEIIRDPEFLRRRLGYLPQDFGIYENLTAKFDMTKPPFVISGFPFRSEFILPRLVSLIWPIPLLLISLARFHRFNPDRIKTTSRRIRQGLIGKINALAKPVSAFITAPFSRVVTAGNKPSFIRSVAAEVLLTLQIYPAATLLIAFFTIFFLFLSPAGIQNTLPLAFAAMVLVLADMATREKDAGTMPIVFAAPGLRRNFVLRKVTTAIILAFGFTWIAALKLLFAQPFGALAVVGGTIFAAACATGLGIMTSSPKAFIVLFLFFLYLVMNDGGHNASFDFAGWFQRSTPAVVGAYATISVAWIAAAESFHRWQLKRNY